MTQPVRRVLVVVPARDEQDLVDDCLASLERAVAQVAVPVAVSVVLDRCVDRTAAVVAARPAVRAMRCDVGLVGAARRLGVARALAAVGHDGADGLDLAGTWIVCTDADSQVPPDWIEHHLELADGGADLVLGTVTLASDDAPSRAWWREYGAMSDSLARSATTSGRPGSGHPHVHGANLGVRADVYQAAGGFPPVGAHEDVLLVRAVRDLPGARVLATLGAPVRTSGRRFGRAPQGVAADLRTIAAQVLPVPGGVGAVRPAQLAGPVTGQ